MRIDGAIDAQVPLELAKNRLRSLVVVAKHQLSHILVSPLELFLSVVLPDESELVC